MRVAERKDDVLPLDLGLVPDPLDLELLAEASRHTRHRVRDGLFGDDGARPLDA